MQSVHVICTGLKAVGISQMPHPATPKLQTNIFINYTPCAVEDMHLIVQLKPIRPDHLGKQGGWNLRST